jgi:hypothetical protein
MDCSKCEKQKECEQTQKNIEQARLVWAQALADVVQSLDKLATTECAYAQAKSKIEQEAPITKELSIATDSVFSAFAKAQLTSNPFVKVLPEPVSEGFVELVDELKP